MVTTMPGSLCAAFCSWSWTDMARFDFYGTDELEISFAELAQLTDEDKEKIIMPGAEVIRKHQVEILESDHNSKILAPSIVAEYLPGFEEGVALIEPKGIHHGKKTVHGADYHRPKTGQGRSHKRKRHGLTAGTTNQEVGYYLEYGTPRMYASHWMERANEKAADETNAAMEKAWDELLTSKGL